jgi:hypothetical protein
MSKDFKNFEFVDPVLMRAIKISGLMGKFCAQSYVCG